MVTAQKARLAYKSPMTALKHDDYKQVMMTAQNLLTSKKTEIGNDPKVNCISRIYSWGSSE
jgi:hypothetical protein